MEKSKEYNYIPLNAVLKINQIIFSIQPNLRNLTLKKTHMAKSKLQRKLQKE